MKHVLKALCLAGCLVSSSWASMKMHQNLISPYWNGASKRLTPHLSKSHPSSLTTRKPPFLLLTSRHYKSPIRHAQYLPPLYDKAYTQQRFYTQNPNTDDAIEREKQALLDELKSFTQGSEYADPTTDTAFKNLLSPSIEGNKDTIDREDYVLHFMTERSEGRKEGEEKGRKEEKKEIAQNMLKEGLTDQEITELTGLPLSDIQQIRSALREYKTDTIDREDYALHFMTERSEGRKEGEEKGRKEGEEKGRKEIAQNMLKKGLTDQEITELTGLPLSDIQQIRAARNL